MITKKGIFKVEDGVFHSGYPAGTDGVKIKNTRYYYFYVLEINGIKIMFNTEPRKTEIHYSADGVNEDSVTISDTSQYTTGLTSWIGDNIQDIMYRFTMGMVEPVTEWIEPLTEFTSETV